MINNYINFYELIISIKLKKLITMISWNEKNHIAISFAIWDSIVLSFNVHQLFSFNNPFLWYRKLHEIYMQINQSYAISLLILNRNKLMLIRSNDELIRGHKIKQDMMICQNHRKFEMFTNWNRFHLFAVVLLVPVLLVEPRVVK